MRYFYVVARINSHAIKDITASFVIRGEIIDINYWCNFLCEQYKDATEDDIVITFFHELTKEEFDLHLVK